MTQPDWYTGAVAEEPELATVRTSGVATALRMWGPADGAPVVLVHGGAAHAAWWDHIGPLLVACRVVALDLSGHGDSAWRDDYRIDVWRDEVLAVIRSVYVTERPLLVGHSMGGLVAYATARDHADELGGALIVDSGFPRQAEGDSWRTLRDAQRRVYSDRQEMIDRFRLMPHSEPRSPFVIDHVARESIVAVDGGWSWKFDPRVFAHDGLAFEDVFPIADCHVAIVRGDHGLLDDGEAYALSERLGGSGVVTLADCGHHVLLDRPLELADIIQSNVPRRPSQSASWEPGNTIIGGS